MIFALKLNNVCLCSKSENDLKIALNLKQVGGALFNKLNFFYNFT